jgi:sugar (pentulose or hexulose) kinase
MRLFNAMTALFQWLKHDCTRLFNLLGEHMPPLPLPFTPQAPLLPQSLVAVLDIGKTMAKLSLWSQQGVCVAKASRPNASIESPHYPALNVEGLTEWLVETLKSFTQHGEIGAIIPVAHGATWVAVKHGALALPVMDYETEIPADIYTAYCAERGAFAETFSPQLPQGLNFGAQIYWAEQLAPEAMAGATLMPWPQFWAWLLCGVAASEVSSLGCHSDCWAPVLGAYSALARRRGWAARFAPLRHAGEVLGTLLPAWAERMGLPRSAQIYCGLHDSNAALVAARSTAALVAARSTAALVAARVSAPQAQELSVVSTGTWFIAMRSGAALAHSLPEARDCLMNVDVHGQPVPSARFMGGREIEAALETCGVRLDDAAAQAGMWAALPKLLEAQTMFLPSAVQGCGPYPQAQAKWCNRPQDFTPQAQAAAVALYAALMCVTLLSLIGARGCVLIEGRFARAPLFTQALANLRPELEIYTATQDLDVSFGALHLVVPQQSAQNTGGALLQVLPLEHSLAAYAKAWHETLHAT